MNEKNIKRKEKSEKREKSHEANHCVGSQSSLKFLVKALSSFVKIETRAFQNPCCWGCQVKISPRFRT